MVRVEDRAISRFSSKGDIHALGFFRKYLDEVDSGESQVVLLNPESCGNLGAICRTMVAFGVNQLVIIGAGADFFHPSTFRASMGAIFRLKHQCFEDFISWNRYFRGESFFLSPQGAIVIRNVKLKAHFALVFGSEG